MVAYKYPHQAFDVLRHEARLIDKGSSSDRKACLNIESNVSKTLYAILSNSAVVILCEGSKAKRVRSLGKTTQT